VIRILLISYNSVMTSGILQSQVASLLKRLKSQYPEKLDFYLITAEKWDDLTNQPRKASFLKDMKSHGVNVYLVPKFLPSQLKQITKKESYFNLLKTLFCFLADMILLGLLSLWLILTKRIHILHARSYIPAMLALYLKKITGRKVVFDPRGIIPEELQLTKNWDSTNPQYLRWKKIEQKLLTQSDEVIVLSIPFSEHYQKMVPSLKPIIVPCAVDIDHFRPFTKKANELQISLGLQHKYLVLYTMGHFVPYQDFDSAIKIFQQISAHIPNAHFLVLTPDTAAVSQALENKIPASSFTVLSASFDQMPIYISMAQIGLMVRIPSLITSVSSPVKLAEYLACGLPVIAQTGIGYTDQILSERKAGIILKSDALTDADLHWLSQLASPEYRASVSSDCILLAKSHFSWDLYLDTYFQLYSRLSPLTP